MSILYSIVIPIYNEQENILPLTEEIEWVMKAYPNTWELIFVDDGSKDGSRAILKALHTQKPHIRYITLAGNFGQTSALAAGFKACKGEWVVTLDGDGQNDPRDIPLLIETCKNSPGCDLVSGIRRKRQDPWYKRIISRAANSVRRRILHDNTKDTGCSLKLYRKSALDKIPLYKGMHRFLPALFQIEGFTTKEVAVNHRERTRGKSKYNLFNRGLALVYDLMAVAWMRKRKLTYKIEHEA